MSRTRIGNAVSVLVSLFILSGCGWFGEDRDDELDDVFPQLGAVEEPAEIEPEITEGNLELKLKQGDRFPLLKTIEQTLTQETPEGPITSTSTLRLLMAVSIDEQRPDGYRRMGVNYQRVQYVHNVSGERLVYDSQSPPQLIPEALLAYHGLANNGFGFWLSPENQIVELIGFEGFLERCTQNCPPSSRQKVLQQIGQESVHDGVASFESIANFVDDSIGLLPYNATNPEATTVQVGERWTRNRDIRRPVPMQLVTEYTLNKIDDQFAHIGIRGAIKPAAIQQVGYDHPAEFKISMTGGFSSGYCLIDRKTGLPVDSQVQRDLDMNVQLAGGNAFQQHKTIVTTIQTFPHQNAGATSSSGVQPSFTAPEISNAGNSTETSSRAQY